MKNSEIFDVIVKLSAPQMLIALTGECLWQYQSDAIEFIKEAFSYCIDHFSNQNNIDEKSSMINFKNALLEVSFVYRNDP